MDHDESTQNFQRLLVRESECARDAAIGLEALVVLLPTQKSRQLAHLQVKASHQQAKEFCELAQKVREN